MPMKGKHCENLHTAIFLIGTLCGVQR